MRYRHFFVGGAIGLVFGLILLPHQHADIAYYYLAGTDSLAKLLFAQYQSSPWFILVYSITLFGLVGFVIGSKWRRVIKILAVITLMSTHLILAYLSLRNIPHTFKDFKIPPVSIDTNRP